MRRAVGEAEGVLSPAFWVFAMAEAPTRLAARVSYPCVLKPLSLSASRGVIRANDPAEFIAAFREIAAILHEAALDEDDPGANQLLVEEFSPRCEGALA